MIQKDRKFNPKKNIVFPFIELALFFYDHYNIKIIEQTAKVRNATSP